MAYVRAATAALLAALALGAALGVRRALAVSFERLQPSERAAVLAASISEAANCVAFFAVVMIPSALIAAYVVRKRRRAPSAPR